MKKYFFLLALLVALSACGTAQSGLKNPPVENQSHSAGSMIELRYDGLTGELKNMQTSPEDLNPCNP